MPFTSPAKRFPVHISLLGVAAACIAAHAADFAPPGARAVVSVDYVYESAGRKSSNGMYDPYEWKVRRTVSMVADLAAQPPTAMPTVQQIDSAQMAQLQGKSAKAQAVASQMAPLTADIHKIMAKCGEDEACISREAQKMGTAMANDPQKMAAAANARKGAQELSRQDAPRYQAWRATAQRGTYAIDETVHISVTDPICTSKPRHRCTRDETRKGGGDVPALEKSVKGRKVPSPGLSAVEVDAIGNSLVVGLPVPMAMLPYTETILTDEPEGTHETPTPKGPQQRQRFFRVSAEGSSGVMHDKPLAVPLKGGWRSQEGEYAVPLKGDFGDAGTLRVRWRFKAQ
jgi:hypothetical protein